MLYGNITRRRKQEFIEHTTHNTIHSEFQSDSASVSVASAHCIYFFIAFRNIIQQRNANARFTKRFFKRLSKRFRFKYRKLKFSLT